MLDIIIVGAGPAGLSAALILGRCRREVLVFDTGVYRNAASDAMHGFLSRDGIPPAEFRQIARTQLEQYRTVNIAYGEVVNARCVTEGFEVTLRDDSVFRCRKLLVATGMVDDLPPVKNIIGLYGKSVFHCPYCDGWERRDQPLAVYGKSESALGLALELTGWSKDIIVCTDGPADIDEHGRARLARHAIGLREEPIDRLEGDDGQLRRIVFADGGSIDRSAMFFTLKQHPSSPLPAKLGCDFTHHGSVATGRYEATNIPGLYVAGDASRAVQLAIVAASEGAEAAFAINTSLLKEDLARSEGK